MYLLPTRGCSLFVDLFDNFHVLTTGTFWLLQSIGATGVYSLLCGKVVVRSLHEVDVFTFLSWLSQLIEGFVVLCQNLW